MDLKQARAEIDAIDDELVLLFHRRREVVRKLIQWKREQGVALRDAARESEIVERAVCASGMEDAESTRQFVSQVLGLCQDVIA